MSPETFWGIITVVFFVLGLIIFLSLIGVAGRLGDVLEKGLKVSFGYGAYLIPFALIWGAYLLLKTQRNKEYQIKNTEIVGVVLLFICLGGFFHSLSKPTEYLHNAQAGLGGGYVGYIVLFPLEKVIGIWASFVVLIACGIVGVVLVLNKTPGELVDLLIQFKKFSVSFFDKFRKRKAIQSAGLRVKGLDNNYDGDIDGEGQKKEAGTSLFKTKSFPALSFKKKKEKQDSPVQTSRAESNYKPYPLSLLDTKGGRPESGDIRANAQIIEQTLKSFDIGVSMEEVNIGPTVTQYTFRPRKGVKLHQITTLQNDLSLALAAHPLRIEAPIPGRSLVGIEIPNKKVALVRLREILESPEYQKAPGMLNVSLGRDVSGNPNVSDISKMPHLLIAGATGSGKSVAIHVIVLSLLAQNSPEDLRLILVDPKKVELTCYNDVPHLLTPVITDVDKTINSLRWTVAEMERRFILLSESGKRDIQSYNKAYPDNKLPYIVAVIDELADLMSVAANEVEAAVVRLAQMSRAVGIHLILATQRPSVNIITGLIKANITARIAFTVASQVDSRTIIDSAGAEKLLGKGDMLYVASELGKPRRIQGAYITENEIGKVVSYIKEQGEPEYNEEVVEKNKTSRVVGATQSMDDEDDYFDEARTIVIQAGKASASLLQRRLKVGYARAARLLDSLEEQGIVGPADGAKPREVFVQTNDDMGDDMPPADLA